MLIEKKLKNGELGIKINKNIINYIPKIWNNF